MVEKMLVSVKEIKGIDNILNLTSKNSAADSGDSSFEFIYYSLQGL